MNKAEITQFRPVVNLAPAAKPRLLFIGLMIGQTHGNVTSQGLVLSDLLRDAGYAVTRASGIRARIPRLADIVQHLVRRLSGADIVVLEVYSGLSVVIAETASFMAGIWGKPVIMVLHGGALPTFTSRYPRFMRRLLSRACKLVSPSLYLDRYARSLGFQCTVIPNVIDLSKYVHKRRLRVQPRLFWMRSLHDIYNPFMALRVIQQVRQRWPEARLVLAGMEKGLGPSLKDWSIQNGLQDTVEFPGFLDTEGKKTYGGMCDIFINTSRVDNMPVAFLEAAAMGLPIISTNVGGIPDLIEHGRTGLLVDDDDDTAMTAAISEVVDNPSLALSLADAAAELAELSSWHSVHRQWNSMFEAVLSGR